MMKFSTIGTSWITESFVKAALTIDEWEYAGAYSRSLDKATEFSSRFGVKKGWNSLEDMLSDDSISAVYVASPNKYHYEHSKKCLEKGKNVICEKPLCVNPNEIEELQSLAAEKGLIYMEAIMFLYTPELVSLRDMMNKIGNITSAHFDFSQLSSKYKLLSEDYTPNIFNPELAAGCLMDIGVYNVYTALALFGKPVKITSDSYFMFTGADSHGTAIFDYSDKQVTLNYSKVAQSYGYSQIFGDKGTILLPSISQLNDMKVCFSDGSGRVFSDGENRTRLMSYEAKAFLEFIKGNTEYSVGYEYASELALNVSETMKIIRSQNRAFRF